VPPGTTIGHSGPVPQFKLPSKAIGGTTPLTEPAYRIELKPPDITAYRSGNTGIDFVTTFDSGKSGPHVLVNALTHGNELCGPIALDFLFRQGVRPARGRLTLCFANVAAYQCFDPSRPGASRFVDEDFNRLWSPQVLDGPRNTVELTRARVLRPLYDTVDLLLDLHSMQHATPPLVLCGVTERGRRLAQAVRVPQWIVSDSGHASGRRLLDYAGFADPAGGKTALLAECGQHWERQSATVAIDVTLRFLLATGAIAPDFAAPHLSPEPPPDQKMIEITDAITVKGTNLVYEADYYGMEIIERRGTLIARDDDTEIRTPYDNCVLIMPSRRLRRGQTAVRLGRIVS
jgi:predicted deacylase